MNLPRILLADDHRMVAEGIKSLLSKEFELVGWWRMGAPWSRPRASSSRM
jgi:DNA-binding NarL/FixJ family response regulator